MREDQFIRLSEMDRMEAKALVMKEYKEEASGGNLPAEGEIEEMLEDLLGYLMEQDKGIAYLEEGKLSGFIGYLGPWDKFKGKSRGIFVPSGASAFGGKNRARTASLVTGALMEQLIMEDKVTAFAISRFANDHEVGNVLNMNGFGITNTDRILDVNRFTAESLLSCQGQGICGTVKMEGTVVVKELSLEERTTLIPLYDRLAEHLRQAPCFITTPDEAAGRWAKDENVRVFAAVKEERPIGFLSMVEEGETFVSVDEKMWNIGATYVLPEFRHTGLSQALIYSALRACKDAGIEYLGVDHETTNAAAQSFWSKYFTPYTYSYVRRVNEDVVLE